jgi:hypothetical protein
LADNIAKEILQCLLITSTKARNRKSGNYLEEAMKLAKLAESVAINDATKNKVKENISTLEGNERPRTFSNCRSFKVC